jgi:hypothetical protein
MTIGVVSDEFWVAGTLVDVVEVDVVDVGALVAGEVVGAGVVTGVVTVVATGNVGGAVGAGVGGGAAVVGAAVDSEGRDVVVVCARARAAGSRTRRPSRAATMTTRIALRHSRDNWRTRASGITLSGESGSADSTRYGLDMGAAQAAARSNWRKRSI